MKWIAPIVMTLLVAACASSPRDSSDTQRRLEAERELARDCRMAARMRTYDPRCPQAEDMDGPETRPIEPPRLPDITAPRS